MNFGLCSFFSCRFFSIFICSECAFAEEITNIAVDDRVVRSGDGCYANAAHLRNKCFAISCKFCWFFSYCLYHCLDQSCSRRCVVAKIIQSLI
uniref:Putative secreted protein n=1 Tax=Anopheles marajoara TaxID=58244 RepID=A0A2M4CAM1_9DIPT